MFRGLLYSFFPLLFALGAPLPASAFPLIDIYTGSPSCRSIAEAALSTEGLTFRFANSKDHEELQSLINDVRKEFIKEHEFLEDTFDEDLISIDETYNQKENQLFIIQNKNGKILGSGGFFRTSPTSVEIRKIYFSREIRGRRLSGPWLDYLIDQAFHTGVARIWLVNHHDLKDATKLYARKGFKLYTPDQSEHSVPTDSYHYFQLIKRTHLLSIMEPSK